MYQNFYEDIHWNYIRQYKKEGMFFTENPVMVVVTLSTHQVLSYDYKSYVCNDLMKWLMRSQSNYTFNVFCC